MAPGLQPGWQQVRVRTANSRYSNAVSVAVDMPALCEHVTIIQACDANTHQRFELERRDKATLSIWVAGLPDNADRHNVRVRLGRTDLRIEHVAPPQGKDRPRQINAALVEALEAGEVDLTVSLGKAVSAPARIRVN